MGIVVGTSACVLCWNVCQCYCVKCCALQQIGVTELNAMTEVFQQHLGETFAFAVLFSALFVRKSMTLEVLPWEQLLWGLRGTLLFYQSKTWTLQHRVLGPWVGRHLESDKKIKMLLFIPQILVALLSLLGCNIIEKQCSDITKLASHSSHFGERKLRKKILFTWDIAIYLLLNITVSGKWFFLKSWDFKICFVFSIFCIKIV